MRTLDITPINEMFIGLQFFAEDNSMMNATIGYVNGNTGQVTPFSGSNDLSAEAKEFYDTMLLENWRVNQYYGQFAARQPLPAGHSGVVEFRRFKTFKTADKLLEGVVPDPQVMGVEVVRGTISQHGTYTTITDKLELRSVDNILLAASEEMGASANKTQEYLIRDFLYTGGNVLYCDNLDADGEKVGDTPTSEEELQGKDGVVAKMTAETMHKAAMILTKNRAKKINERWYAVVHPSVAFDLTRDPEWIEASKYAAPDQLLSGEIGEVRGVRIIESPDAPVMKGMDLVEGTRTLSVNHEGGYTGAVTTIAFDGAEVKRNELVGRIIKIGDVKAMVIENSATEIIVEETNFGNIADNAVIEPGEGGADGVAVYPTYVFGLEPFAIIDAEGGNLEMIIKPKEQAGGPLNQYSTIGYKFEAGAVMLYPERMLRIMSSSTSAEIDEPDMSA